jgi:transposase-like protein
MMSTKEVAVMNDVPDEVQRWTAKRRSALVMSIIKGETSVAEAARKHGLTVAEWDAPIAGTSRRVSVSG